MADLSEIRIRLNYGKIGEIQLNEKQGTDD